MSYPWRIRNQASGVRVLTVTVVVSLTAFVRAERPADPPPRAQPPEWSADVLDAFFEDARKVLQGERPNYAALGSVGRRQVSAGSTPAASDRGQSGRMPWSQLISADAIETEIKRLAPLVRQDTATATPFKGGGYRKCQDDFSMLAALFAVSADYDGTVRWQDAAAGLRELFAQAGFSCEEGTDESFREAVSRGQDLADLVRGGRPEVPAAERATDWVAVADRTPLMRRIEKAHQSGLSKWLAEPGEFRRHRDDVLHEAQLLAMLAQVVGQESYEGWDDAPYAEYSAALRQAAQDMAKAAEQNEYPPARDALGRATKACSDCHERYRG